VKTGRVRLIKAGLIAIVILADAVYRRTQIVQLWTALINPDHPVIDLLLYIGGGVIVAVLSILGGIVGTAKTGYRRAFFILGAFLAVICIITGIRNYRAALATVPPNKIIASANEHSDKNIAEVTALAQKAIDETTGGNSYPVVSPMGKIDAEPGMPLMITVVGEYDLVGATIQLMPHTQELRGLNPKKSSDRLTIIDRLIHPQVVTLPIVSNKGEYILA